MNHGPARFVLVASRAFGLGRQRFLKGSQMALPLLHGRMKLRLQRIEDVILRHGGNVHL